MAVTPRKNKRQTIQTGLTVLCIDIADGLQQQQRVELCVLDKDEQQLQSHLGHCPMLHW